MEGTEETQEKVQLLQLDNGLLWPFYNNVRAWSASRLTYFIRELEYKNIPEYILQIAAKRGKIFHEVIQDFFKSGVCPSFVDDSEGLGKLDKTKKRIYETISFLRKQSFFQKVIFLGSEELHYTTYGDELIATYSDIHFSDFILELKTSNIKSKDNPLLLLVFEIQLLIQNLCTKKDVYLLWSTGEGIIFSKFQKSPKLLKILNILILIAKSEEKYTENEKKVIIKKILDLYTPKQLSVLR